jgi:hypothetical protein
MKSKYFHDTSFWRPNPSRPKSAFWASILKVLPTLQRHSFYQIAYGSISALEFPLCDAWINIYDDLIIQSPGFSYPAAPKDLWLLNQKKWNHQLIDSLFLPRTAKIIKNTTILQIDQPNILCWKLTLNGKCNYKSAYTACL